MARTDPQLNFRIPAELREKLDAAAASNKRSLTSELIARLQASFEEPAHGEALTTSTADAVQLLLKKVEGIEARLIQPEGTSLLKTGTPSLSPSQENPFAAIRKPQAPQKAPTKKPA